MPGYIQFLTGQFSTPPEITDDLTGRTIIVTGSNTGLGLDAAKILLKHNCSTIILAVRTLAKGHAARDTILASSTASNKPHKTNIEVWHLNMSVFSSVVNFSQQCATLPRIDAVILNAGVHLTEFSLAEGYESTLTINIISTFLLATLLLPMLRASATKFNITTNIAIVGSAVHFWADEKQLLNAPKGSVMQSLSVKEKADMKGRYYLSKLPVMLLVKHLAERVTASAAKDPKGTPLVVLTNVAPGFCQTDLFRHDAGAAKAASVIGRSSELGARTLVHGAVVGKEGHGQYLSECRVKPASKLVRSKDGEKVGKELWEELMGIYREKGLVSEDVW